MSVFVGLDCGGSSSRVMAVDDSGEILYQGQSGAANVASTPEGRLRKNLGHATSGCPKPDYVCGCFAGLVNDQMRERALMFLRDQFPQAALRAEPDYTAALFASKGTDISVIAGTGSLVCSRTGGKIVKSGGRGYILGDEGSGYYFGRDALLQHLNYPDETSESLTKALIEVFGSTAESEIVVAVYRAPTPATILAKLAKAVANDAAAGKQYAIQSLHNNLRALASVVERHIVTYHSADPELHITLSGGVWKASALYRDIFHDHLKTLLPSKTFEIQRLTKPPLLGAVELAREMAQW